MTTIADRKAIRAALRSGVAPMLWGAPGIGKTDSIYAIAKEDGFPVIDWRVLLRDPVDARGLPVPDLATGTTKWLRPSDLPFIGNDCPEEGYLFLDEINAGSQAMQGVGMQLVHEHAVGEHKLKPGWKIIAAGNRQSDRAIANRMPSALANRFVHLDVHCDSDSWSQWAIGAGLPALIIAFVRFRPGLLHLMPGAKDSLSGVTIPNDARAFPTPRAYKNAAAIYEQVQNESADIRMRLLSGVIGDGPATELEGFRRIFHNAPKLADIVANPRGAPLPDSADLGTIYAVTSALALKATRDTFAPIVEYVGRLPRDYGVTCVVQAVRRDASLQTTQAFVSWAQANQDVTL